MYFVGKAPGIPSTYKLVFIIVVIEQFKIVQETNLVQMASNKMAATCITMVIIVDDVVLVIPINNSPQYNSISLEYKLIYIFKHTLFIHTIITNLNTKFDIKNLALYSLILRSIS